MWHTTVVGYIEGSLSIDVTATWDEAKMLFIIKIHT